MIFVFLTLIEIEAEIHLLLIWRITLNCDNHKYYRNGACKACPCICVLAKLCQCSNYWDVLCRCACIIDCFEFFIENLKARKRGQKHTAITNIVIHSNDVTRGRVSFISKGWAGRTSDKHLIDQSGFFGLPQPGWRKRQCDRASDRVWERDSEFWDVICDV